MTLQTVRTSDGSKIYLRGCWRASGRTHVLAQGFSAISAEDNFNMTRVRGKYGLTVENVSQHVGTDSETLRVFDLTTGRTATGRGGEAVSCPAGNGCSGALDFYTYGTTGITAAHTIRQDASETVSTQEQIVVSDANGVRVLDTAPFPSNAPSTPRNLTDMRIQGTTVSWRHDGVLHSAELTPYSSITGPCAPPAQSQVVATSPQAVMTMQTVPTDSGSTVYLRGCWRPSGQTHVLAQGFSAISAEDNFRMPRIRGKFGLTVESVSQHVGTDSDTLRVFDLTTGQPAPGRGGEAVSCPAANGCSDALDFYTYGTTGITAAHTVRQDFSETVSTEEQFVVSDALGVRVLDTAPFPSNAPSTPRHLTDMRIQGTTVSWRHDGVLHSAELTPYSN